MVVADRYYCSYWLVAMLRERGADELRPHAPAPCKSPTSVAANDFRPGRPRGRVVLSTGATEMDGREDLRGHSDYVEGSMKSAST